MAQPARRQAQAVEVFVAQDSLGCISGQIVLAAGAHFILSDLPALEQDRIQSTYVRLALPLILDLKMQVGAGTEASRSYDAQLLPYAYLLALVYGDRPTL